MTRGPGGPGPGRRRTGPLAGGLLTAGLLAAVLAAPVPAAGQEPSGADSLVAEADRAARRDAHERAVALYREALARDPALADPLAGKLGRQLLWAGDTGEALRWLERARELQPDDCGLRLDVALALSWAGRLDRAATAYRAAASPPCEAREGEALAGLGRVRRWQESLRRAERLYAELARSPGEQARRAGRIGLGHTARALYRPRTARRWFAAVWSADSTSVEAAEGLAHAYMDLELDGRAGAVLDRMRRLGIHAPGLTTARRRLSARQSFGVAADATRFWDSDDTDFLETRLTARVPLAARTELELAGSRIELDGPAGTFEIWSPGLRLAHRFSADWRLEGGIAVHAFDEPDEERVTGAGELLWMPTDGFRLGLSGGRTWLPDNFAALAEDVAGPFAGLEMALGLGSFDDLVLRGHLTRWSSDRHRFIGGVRWTHRFQGVPRLTLDWPTRVQAYDEPFSFALWSPEFYVESGPGLHLYQPLGGGWGLNLFGRGGIQRETGLDASGLAVVRGTLEWELAPGSRLHLGGGWSNSSVVGAQGFRRTTARAGLTVRF